MKRKAATQATWIVMSVVVCIIAMGVSILAIYNIEDLTAYAKSFGLDALGRLVDTGGPQTPLEKAIACSYYRCVKGCDSKEVEELWIIDNEINCANDYCGELWQDEDGKICAHTSKIYPIELELREISHLNNPTKINSGFYKYLHKTPACFPMRQGGDIINVKDSLILEDTCPDWRDDWVPFANDMCEEFDVKPNMYYIFSEYTPFPGSGTQMILCDSPEYFILTNPSGETFDFLTSQKNRVKVELPSLSDDLYIELGSKEYEGCFCSEEYGDYDDEWCDPYDPYCSWQYMTISVKFNSKEFGEFEETEWWMIFKSFESEEASVVEKTFADGNYILTYNHDEKSGTAQFQIQYVGSIGTGPHIEMIDAPSSVSVDDNFDVTLKYTHSGGEQGGVMLRWWDDDFDFVSSTCSLDEYYKDPKDPEPFAVGWEGQECSFIEDGSVETITLKANLEGEFKLHYRAWDLSEDADCNGRSDYHRDPEDSTCSLNCEVFPRDWAICDSHDFQISVVPTGLTTCIYNCMDEDECDYYSGTCEWEYYCSNPTAQCCCKTGGVPSF